MPRKEIPAYPSRDRSRDDESLLLRSAESLGRMIGSLQRQLDVATGRLATSKDGVARSKSNGTGKKQAAAKRSAKAKSGTTNTAGGTRKRSSAGRTGARKSAKKR